MPEPKLQAHSGQGKSRVKPGRMGGILIRRLIKTLRDAQLTLPLEVAQDSQILIACSGGIDSSALAILITKYGKKICPQAGILHVNHGLRGEQSNADALWVRDLARSLQVPFILEGLEPETRSKGHSIEEWARNARKRLFRKHAGPRGIVFTGHQADELSETLVWRLFTGSSETHSGGVLVQDGLEIRPLLRCKKSELRTFLEEEGQEWREDSSNSDTHFLRARFREVLLPILNEHYPRWQQHFLRLVERAQSKTSGTKNVTQSDPFNFLIEWFGTAGVRLRRVHLERMTHWLKQMESPISQAQTMKTRTLDSVHLPNGWRARLEIPKNGTEPRVVLERASDLDEPEI